MKRFYIPSIFMTDITQAIYQYLFKKCNWLFLALLLLGFSPQKLLAQTDTEFWFVVPEITINHSYPGGVPAYFKLSSGSLPASVTISMPAGNPAIFPDIPINLGANDFQVVDVSCWIVSPCNPIVGTSTDNNLLENKPSNASGINNFGILITSTAPITAYYEVSNSNNKDIWALKGRNALGTTFFTPFQNQRNNDTYSPNYPYSAIDIVATQDNTTVRFTLPPGIQASYGAPATTRPAGSTFTVTLNRGQTFSLFPRWRTDLAPPRISQDPAHRLVGVKVESVNGEPIAITTKDDSFFHTSGTCRDVAGDQMIPTNIIGKEYAAIRTALNNQDNLYLLATEDATQITVYDDAGNVVNSIDRNTGQQFHQPLPDGQTYYRIVADKPIYVWHIGGFGCEVGGAVLPPIDKCTGVPRVSFARTSSETFYIIMMVRKGAENFFTFNGAVRNDLFPPGNFTELLPLPSDWSVARFGPFSTAQIPVGTHYMENSEDIFHLGIVNGGGSTGCFYGYFSDYNEFAPTTLVVETGTSGGRVCVGETLQLYADGGTSYLWSPADWLSDATSPTPVINNIPGSETFSVQISGACDRDTTISLSIQAAGPVDVLFEPDTHEGCAKPPAGGGTPVYNFTFTNQSTGDYSREWRWREGPSGPITTFAAGNDASADPADIVSVDLPNDTDAPIEYHITLIGGSDPPFCFSEHTEIVTVYPYIDVESRADIFSGCQPLDIEFEANPIGHSTGATYMWDFGDGQAAIDTQDPTHQYYDPTPLGWIEKVHYAVATITDQWGVCRDKDSVLITVYPYIESDFFISDTLGCAPLEINIINSSLGGIDTYTWDINSNPVGHPVTGVAPNTNTFTRTLNNTTAAPIDYTFELTVSNGHQACNKIAERTVTVNPQVSVEFAPNSDIVLCDSTQVSFNSTIEHPSLPNVNYSWTFGDGGISHDEDPTHLYRNLSDSETPYTIMLTAISEFGCKDTETALAEVSPRIMASFSVDKPVICSGEEVSFTYHRMGSINSYTFEFLNPDNSVYAAPYTYNDLLNPGAFTKIFINGTGAPKTVTVRFTVENGNPNCTKVLEKDIIVNPKVSALFIPDFGSNTKGCNPLTVDFPNSTVFTGGTTFNGTYHWDFGDGASSQLKSPDHEFNNNNPTSSVTYTVTLTSTSVHGCADTQTADIEVQPFLQAAFSIDPGSICSPTDVTFTPSSIGATRYLWDFDGIIPIETRFDNTPFTHTFTSSDPNSTEVKTITLTVENAAGCTDLYSLPITLYPLVISDFTASVEEGCSDLEVTFTNESSGGSVEYDWDFGDGQSFSTTSSVPIVHTFSNRTAATKVYSVKLVATNASGCTSESSIDITVLPKVEANFTFTHDSVCTPFDVAFENGSLNGNEFQWDFGRMGKEIVSYNKDPFTMLFENTTANDILTYTIELVALDNVTGCSDTTTQNIVVNPRVVVDFDADVSSGCNPLVVQFTNNSTGLGSYLWEFGDETSGTASSPLKTFIHTDRENSKDFIVKLTSTNADGCKDSDIKTITVFPLVEANFTIDDADGCTPITVQINNSTVSPAYTYEWDFGNAQTSAEAQPLSITFINDLSPLQLFQPNIVLTTRYVNDETCMAIDSKPITVYPHIHPSFSGNFEGCQPHPVEFTNTTNSFGGLASASYRWDFKNGAFSNNINPQETFTNTSFIQDSLFDVQLRATSMHGCVDSVNHTITVHPNPRARIELDDDNIDCSPFEVTFYNQSEGVGLTFTYDFGDGADSLTTSDSPMVHVFRNLSDELKPYMTTLTAETEYGCTHQFFQTLWAYPEVEADFYFNPGSEACNPFTVTMVNQSVNTWYWEWDFDDGSTSYLKNPTHTFLNPTTIDSVFNVTLTSFSEFDCMQSRTLPVTVYAQPSADFSIDPPLKVYPDADFLFTNQTHPASPDWSYRWDFGDGRAGSQEMHPGTYTYSTWGPAADNFRYFVTLSVANNHCNDQITYPLTLSPADPIALFEADTYASCPPLEVRFINASLYGSSFLWNFDDGTTSTNPSPSHTFNEAGYYNVSLTIWGDGGTHTFFDVLRVYPTPIANFTVLPEIVVLPEGQASFYNLSKGANAYLWNFGDGELSTEIDPVHKYKDLGSYKVELIAYTNFNCSDTISRDAAVIVEGEELLRFPNAFIPDKLGPSGGRYNPVDYSNKIFHPVHKGVIEYQLLIFNRWGEQIFKSNDVWVGWDGYRNGELSTQDVYVWRAKGRFSTGKSFDKRGNVTLLR